MKNILFFSFAQNRIKSIPLFFFRRELLKTVEFFVRVHREGVHPESWEHRVTGGDPGHRQVFQMHNTVKSASKSAKKAQETQKFPGLRAKTPRLRGGRWGSAPDLGTADE